MLSQQQPKYTDIVSQSHVTLLRANPGILGNLHEATTKKINMGYSHSLKPHKVTAIDRSWPFCPTTKPTGYILEPWRHYHLFDKGASIYLIYLEKIIEASKLYNIAIECIESEVTG